VDRNETEIPAMLRLVRDYDDDVMEGDEPIMASSDETDEQQPSEPKPRRRRGGAGAAQVTEPEAPTEAEYASEMRDGEVADEAAGIDEATESSEDTAAADAAIDLPLMEALLLSTHHPLTAGRLAELMGLETTKPVRRAIKQLNEQYEQTARAFRIEQVAGGYQILTLPRYGDVLRKLHQKEIDAKLTKAALETLAIIAYKQPILRADIEAIRGVACGETIRSLMEKHLVKIAGRAEEPGRPILYGTTKRFLELFGLNNLKELPKSESLPPQS
jgi:segregation and condensation protein B